MMSRVEGENPQQKAGTVRPRVSVIVPFAGSSADFEGLLAALQSLSLRSGDEVIVVDNRPGPAQRASAPSGIQVHRATDLAGPSFARNAGARLAAGEWLVFIDSDTRPHPDLLDAYFDPPPRSDTAILAGGITDVSAAQTFVARHDVARGRMGQQRTLRREGRPYAQTANCAVRRAAFEAVGGFDELARAGEDADLCFRLQDEGWNLEERAQAGVDHEARQSLRACLAQNLRHGSGAGWLNRRWPGEFPTPGPRWLLVRTRKHVRDALQALVEGNREEAAFVLLDLAEVSARDLGRLISNRPSLRG